MVPAAKTMGLPPAKWYIPRAPYKSSSGVGYTWFSGSDEEGWRYKKSFNLLHALMEQIRAEGFVNENIYIIGFSMGAGFAMEFALRLDYPIGGVVPIAGFLKHKDKLSKDITKASRKTPILVLHGDRDDIVKPESGQKSYEWLLEQGYCVRMEMYSADHTIPVSAGKLIKQFMTDQFNFLKSQVSEYLT